MYRDGTLVVKFHKNFNQDMLILQSKHKWVHSHLPEMLQYEGLGQGYKLHARPHRRMACRNDSCKCLQETASRITRDMLFEMGHRYAQYADTKRMKATGEALPYEWDKSRFKGYSDPLSISLQYAMATVARRASLMTMPYTSARWASPCCPDHFLYQTTGPRPPYYTRQPRASGASVWHARWQLADLLSRTQSQ